MGAIASPSIECVACSLSTMANEDPFSFKQTNPTETEPMGKRKRPKREITEHMKFVRGYMQQHHQTTANSRQTLAAANVAWRTLKEEAEEREGRGEAMAVVA